MSQRKGEDSSGARLGGVGGVVVAWVGGVVGSIA